MRSFRLGKNSHHESSKYRCVMEAVACVAGEPHSDRPKCASEAITILAIDINDACDWRFRQKWLGEMPWRIAGTNSQEHEQRRWAMMNKLLADAAEAYNFAAHYPSYSQDFRDFHMALKCATAEGRRNEFLRWATDVLDKMINLTEIKEAVPVKQPELAAVTA